jgi:hypothetical protein
LTALLTGLLRRNAKDRMEFDDFFNHSFIRKSQTPPTTPPLPVPNLARLSTPPKTPPVTVPARPVPTAPASQNNNATTPEEADDFVLVPSPSQLRSESRGAVVGGINQNEGDTQPLPVPSQRDAFIKVSLTLEVLHSLLFVIYICNPNNLRFPPPADANFASQQRLLAHRQSIFQSRSQSRSITTIAAN